MQNMLPNVPTFTKFGSTYSRERVTLLSLGVRGIAPLRDDRIELFAGASTAHLNSSDTDLTQGILAAPVRRRRPLGNRSGASLLDRPHVRLTRDSGRPTEEWVSLTADFGFRF